MANQTISVNRNGDESAIAGLANGETYTINTNATLTLNSDSRWGQQAAVLGAITIDATTGGRCLIDGRDVWWIPYDGGTGTVPALGTVGTPDVTRGGSNVGEFLGVFTALGVAPSAAASAMPATGFVKLRNKSVTFADNDVLTFTGGATITINSTTGGQRGWLHIVGGQTTTVTVPRLGTFEVQGDFFELGTANGANGQTFQYYVADYCPAIQVETASGSGVYEWWLNPGATRWAQTNRFSTTTRGKFFGCSAAGLITIATSSPVCGYKPPTGCKVRVPNIHISNSSSANWALNIMSTTLTDRWDFTTTNSGVVNMIKANCNNYLLFSQAYALTLDNVGTFDQINISEIATKPVLTNIAVGIPLAVDNTPLSITSCFAGVEITDGATFKYEQESGDTGLTFNDIDALTINGLRMYNCGDNTAATLTRGSAVYLATFTRVTNSTLTNLYCIGTGIILNTCVNVDVINLKYADQVENVNTSTSNGVYAINIGGGSSDVRVSGLVIDDSAANQHPYAGLVTIGASYNCEVKNIGTYASPYNCGSANASGVIVNLGGNGSGHKLRRCYCSNLRTGILGTVNSDTRILIENINGDFADAQAIATLNCVTKNVAATNSTTGQTAVYGTHWSNYFTSTTAGRVLAHMNEPTAVSASECAITSGTPKFLSTGNVSMPTVGDQITMTMPYFLIGCTSLANVAPTLTGTNTGNFTYEYQIDKNDLTGWNGTWKTLSAANLSGETGITADKGFKLKYRITTATGSSTNALTYIRIDTVTNSTDIQRQYYLENPTFTYTGVVTGSSLTGYIDSTDAYIDYQTESGGNAVITTPWNSNYSALIRLRKGGYQPVELTTTITDTSASIPVAMTDWTTIPNTDPGALGITVTNHGASPVTWNSKNFSITITTTNDLLTATDVAQFISWNIANLTSFNGFPGVAWPTLVQPNSTNFETARGRLVGSIGAVLKGVRVVRNDGTTPVPGFVQMQADDGTYWVAPTIGTASNANLLNGSRVRLYNVTTATEIENIVLSSAGYSYTYTDGTTITSGNTVQLRVMKTGYLPLTLTGVASSSGVAWIDSQLADDTYTTNAIDGSTVTEFSADYPNTQIDINEVSGSTTAQRLYAWYQYNLTTADGIRYFVGGLTADDLVNYKVNVGTLDLKLDNVIATPLKITGARMYRSDGTTIIAATSNSIQLDPDKVYAIATGGSALTPAEHARLFDTATNTQGNTIISLSAAAVAK
jgi:hypothetical protein